jgi:hypothetical protein
MNKKTTHKATHIHQEHYWLPATYIQYVEYLSTPLVARIPLDHLTWLKLNLTPTAEAEFVCTSPTLQAEWRQST